MTTEAAPQKFNNGLTNDQEDELYDLIIQIKGAKMAIEEFESKTSRHRSYSLAITKLEEAAHWMSDRLHKPA